MSGTFLILAGQRSAYKWYVIQHNSRYYIDIIVILNYIVQLYSSLTNSLAF